MGVIVDTFKKRKEYDDANFNFIPPNLPSYYTGYYIDTWSVSPFYGKVDTKGVPVIPRESAIRFCTYGTDKQQVSALQPVLEFFFPMREEYKKFYALGSFNANSLYYKNDIPPIRGHINSNIDYPEKIKNLYENFVDYLLEFKKFNKIKNYDDFLNELLIYIKYKNTYITRAGYVESTDYSTLHTGLAIDIFDGNGSDDNLRLDFFKDLNHDAFLELCVMSNLKIDRQIPWRLIVDIRTKARKQTNPDKLDLNFVSVIKEFIPQFDNDLQLFFDTFYYKVVPYDNLSFGYFGEFVAILQSFYISFQTNYQIYKKYLVKDCGKADVTSVKREQLNENLFDYDREKYVNLYLKFRSAELSKVVKEETLKGYTDLSISVYKSQSKNTLSELQSAIIKSIKLFTENVGTLAYRNPSLYELDEKEKMP